MKWAAATGGAAPDEQPTWVDGPGVQGRRSRSRSDAAGALDTGAGDPTLEQRGQPQPAMLRLLTSKEVAGILAVTEPTLARWRSEGKGPSWIELGHRVPRYRMSDLETWVWMQRRGDAG